MPLSISTFPSSYIAGMYPIIGSPEVAASEAPAIKMPRKPFLISHSRCFFLQLHAKYMHAMLQKRGGGTRVQTKNETIQTSLDC